MQSSHNRYKADLFDYQTILDQEELPPSLHCLSATTKMLLLSVLDPIAFKTRYIGNADQATISEWREQAMVQLILDSCGDDLCELIASAIDDCDLVQQSIINLAGQQGWSAGTGDPQKILPVSIREENLLPDDYTCDDDHRYGMAVGLVEYFHGATLEVMELIENATNPLELAAEIGDNVPIWEMAATGADVILWIQETMYDAYVGAWSDTVKDTLACELYCEMVRTGSCFLSLDVIFDMYNDDSLDPPPASTLPLIDWMVWLFDLELSVPLMIVKIATLMPLLALRYGGKFGQVALGIRSLATTVELLADETNGDWEILCDECPDPEWLASIDFTAGDGGYELDDVPVGQEWGVYTASVGWSTTLIHAPGSNRWMTGCAIQLDFTAGTYRLTKSTVTFNYVQGDWLPGSTLAQRITREATHTNIAYTVIEDGDDQTQDTPEAEVTGVTKHRLFIRSSLDVPEIHDYGSALMTKIEIRGRGAVPPELAAYIV